MTARDLPKRSKNDPDDGSKIRMSWIHGFLRPFGLLPLSAGRIRPLSLPSSIPIPLWSQDMIFSFFGSPGCWPWENMPWVKFPFQNLFTWTDLRKILLAEQPEGGIALCSEQERLDYDLGKPFPKMSSLNGKRCPRSKGNIIDPLEMIDQYGTDAIRMALCASATQARQIDLDGAVLKNLKILPTKFGMAPALSYEP